MKDPKYLWAWIGATVVVIAVILWVLWNPQPQQEAATTPAPVYAPQGQLVPQFPKDLIIDSAAAVSGSYSIAYSSSTNQYTAEYNSSDTVTSLYKRYQSYLPTDDWTVTGTDTSHPTFDMIAASQNMNELSVVIQKQGKGSQVTITYLVR